LPQSHLKFCNLTAEQFTLSTVRKGPLKGAEMFLFVHNGDDKTQKLSLENPTTRDSSDVEHAIVNDPDDPMCAFRLLKHHLKFNLPPGYKGRIMLHGFAQGVLKKRRKKGLMWEANTEPRSTTDPTEGGKMGKNRLNTIARTVAVRCDFENAEKFTGRSLRKLGINKMASFGVPTGEMMSAARHGTIAVSNEYQHCNANTAAKRHCSLRRQTKVSTHYVLILIRNSI
jgi:hypothetical protein